MLSFLFVFSASETLVKTLDQYIDHNNKDLGTFKQYYFEVNDNFDPTNGVIILKLGAESPKLDPSGVDDWFKILSERYHAKVFTIQHRFFGKSQPFDDTSTEHLQYLTVDQALEDYSYFYDYYVQTHPDEPIHPWLIVGGSYPGLLSALARKRYPTKFTAAYSSAGVLLASNNLTDFDLQDAISMGQECASIARHTRWEIDQLVDTNREYIIDLLGFNSNFSDFNIYYVVGELFTLSIQYGHLSDLCGPLVDAFKSGNDLLTAFSKYAKEFFYPNYGDPNAYTAQYMQRTINTNESSSRCWLWMTCNELGYWQYSPGRVGIRSPRLNSEEPFLQQCKDVFGIDMKPDVDEFNRKNGGLYQDVTNVLFTTSSQDPWTWACVTEEYVMNNNYAKTIIGNEFGHHFDFNMPKEDDPIDLKRAREQMVMLLDQWLKIN
ncbi:Clan SC, family S28, unassigned serine peptidase [Histomonas meleagridis]|uniref:Clan SC, family S28, unassigned serine peptidase n=1 Tax=Histomonas meleagridis TaxID=135588 RepID=UPI00355A777F|nr:Clan SC, family S28, unassigned serine peptidase [Histomonas meleagridis]KAH0804144.1 Clan SC, family S28, unassigned serine peptidase [Histomonas meleagridis]